MPYVSLLSHVMFLQNCTGILNQFSTSYLNGFIDCCQFNLLYFGTTMMLLLFFSKEMFGKAGVNVLVKFLKMDVGLLSSGLGHFGLLVSAINCVW